LERTHRNEKETTGSENTGDKMAYGKKTPPFSIKQNTPLLRPVWTYGIELWGCANKSNIAIMQRYQSKLL
jgi:hypothetical protein